MSSTTTDWSDWLEDALALVPEGGFEQSLFRASLLNHFSAALTIPRNDRQTVTELVGETVEHMRAEYPSFKPRYSRRLLAIDWPIQEADVRAAESERVAAASAAFLKLR